MAAHDRPLRRRACGRRGRASHRARGAFPARAAGRRRRLLDPPPAALFGLRPARPDIVGGARARIVRAAPCGRGDHRVPQPHRRGARDGAAHAGVPDRRPATRHYRHHRPGAARRAARAAFAGTPADRPLHRQLREVPGRLAVGRNLCPRRRRHFPGGWRPARRGRKAACRGRNGRRLGPGRLHRRAAAHRARRLSSASPTC